MNFKRETMGSQSDRTQPKSLSQQLSTFQSQSPYYFFFKCLSTLPTFFSLSVQSSLSLSSQFQPSSCLPFLSSLSRFLPPSLSFTLSQIRFLFFLPVFLPLPLSLSHLLNIMFLPYLLVSILSRFSLLVFEVFLLTYDSYRSAFF